jgi:(p)ppGpp synthase/HD superfamily hydrolase
MTTTTSTVVVLTPRFVDAVGYAIEAHADQSRKGTAVPYSAHLLAVSALVLEAGGDEEMAIAGLLHDAAEDQGGQARLDDIERRFGPRVADIVRTCSDSLAADPTRKEEYAPRKARYLARLSHAPSDHIIVSMADKLHNARATLTDLRNGVDIFARFHGSPTQVVAYYRECVRIGQEAGVPATLMTPLAGTVEEIAAMMAHTDEEATP